MTDQQQQSESEMADTHANRNKEHWDKMAKTYNSDHTQKQFGDLINKITAFILANINWIGVDFLDPSKSFEANSTSSSRQIRVLDYACGPGTITNILYGRASEFVGMDISPNMADEYNNRFKDDISIRAEAVVADLFNTSASPEKVSDVQYFDFDLVVVGLGFHHFSDLPLATSRLVERLKKGGTLMIVDFKSHDHNDMAGHDAHKTIAHAGFSDAKVKALFENAGLVEVRSIDMDEDVTLRETAKRRPFLAVAKKP